FAAHGEDGDGDATRCLDRHLLPLRHSGVRAKLANPESNTGPKCAGRFRVRRAFGTAPRNDRLMLSTQTITPPEACARCAGGRSRSQCGAATPACDRATSDW